MATQAQKARDDFDLDAPTSARQLEGEVGRELAEVIRRIKARHRRAGAAHVFSSRGGSFLQYLPLITGEVITDYRLTAGRTAKVLQKIVGEHRLMAERIHEAGIGSLGSRWRTDEEVFAKMEPGALKPLDQLYYSEAYRASAVVYGLYPIRTVMSTLQEIALTSALQAPFVYDSPEIPWGVRVLLERRLDADHRRRFSRVRGQLTLEADRQLRYGPDIDHYMPAFVGLSAIPAD